MTDKIKIDIDLNAKKVEKGSKKAIKSLERIQKQVNKLKTNIPKSVAKLGRSLGSSIKKGSMKAGQSFKKMAKVAKVAFKAIAAATTIAAAAVAAVGGAALFVNKRLDKVATQRRVFETLDPGSGKVLDNIVAFNRELGIADEQSLELTNKLIRTFGTAKETEKMNKALQAFGANAGVGTNKMSELADEFSKFTTKTEGIGRGEFNEFSQKVGKFGPSMEDLAKVTGLSMNQVNKQLDKGKLSGQAMVDAFVEAQKRIGGSSNLAQTAIKDSRKSFEAQLGRLNNVAQDFGVKVFQKLFPSSGDDEGFAKIIDKIEIALEKVEPYIDAFKKEILGIINVIGKDDWNEFVKLLKTVGTIVGGVLFVAFKAISIIIKSQLVMWSQFARGLNKIIDYILNLDKAWIHLTKGFKAYINDFKNLGTAIIDGLIGGLVAGWTKIKDKILDLGGSIKNWFKDTLGISSPSKVFEEYGKYSVEGYNKGIQKNQKDSEKVAKKYGKTITEATNRSLSMGKLSSMASIGTLTSNNIPTNYNSGNNLTPSVSSMSSTSSRTDNKTTNNHFNIKVQVNNNGNTNNPSEEIKRAVSSIDFEGLLNQALLKAQLQSV